MNILSSKLRRASAVKSVPTPSPATLEDKPAAPVSNTQADKVWLSNPKPALVGAAIGALATGLTVQASLGGYWGLAGSVAGALAGGWIGENSPQLSYDAKGGVRYLKTRLEATKRAKQYDENEGALKPLLAEFRLSNDPSGDVERLYDGYDSSRNLTGLFANEGRPDEPYRFALEMAHLRPETQGHELHSELLLQTPENRLRLEIEDDHSVKANGQKLHPGSFKAKHSVRYNQVILELNKEVLRQSGWSDGETLEVTAKTRASKTPDSPVFDELHGNTSDKTKEKLFRWEGKTVYQIMTDRFANGDSGNDDGIDPAHHERFHGGDWQGVIDKLDYLEDLGADCIWLSCPYENDRDFFGNDGYHGYWPHDFTAVEKSFGSEEKLRELVDKAHERGMKVLLDVVVNHTGYNHPSVMDPSKRDWFHREGARNPLSQYYLERGSLAGLPDLAQENEEVSRYLIDVHKMWRDKSGVDGFRVDAIRHTPAPFLREFDSAMKEGQDNFLTLGEVFWSDQHYLAGYQNETQDSLFDFPLMQAMRDVFGGNPDQSLSERWSQFQETKKHNFGQAAIDLTKQGGSSMKKLSSVLAKDYAYDNPRLLSTILDNHDTGRFLSQAGGDTSKLRLASAFLMSCRGTPSLYYGTETGMQGQMGANRQDMKFDSQPELRAHFKQLIDIRKNSEALQLGTQTELLAEDESYAFTRVLPGREVICGFNNSDQAQTLKIPLSDTQVPEGAILKSLTDDASYQVKDQSLEITVEARDFVFAEWG